MSDDRAEPELRVTDNPGESRFEATVNGHTGYAEYMRDGKTMYFTHTEVPEELRGRGVAQRIAHEALEYAKREGLRVVAMCPFIRSYIHRHKEYQSLVRSDW